jgi:hypothetical protein
MTKHFTQLIFTVLCVLLATQLCLSQISIEAEEYIVYSDLVRDVYGDDATKQFALEKKIDAKFIEPDLKSLVKKLSLDADLVRDFNERNTSTAEIQNQFSLRSKVSVVGDEVNEVLKPSVRDFGELEEKNWKAFREKYQTFALLSLSRVGFNRNRNKALVVLGSQYGWTGGDGFYYLLVKKRDGWKVKKKVRAWIS